MNQALEVQDLREQVAQLKLKEMKFKFLLAQMPKMCFHYVHHLTQLTDGRVDVKLEIGQIHALERRPEVRNCRVDVESFEEQLDKFIKGVQGMSCNHTRVRYWPDSYNHYSGEMEPTDPTEQSTYEDISIGSCRCTQCGDVKYYTGQWKKFFEDGTPCAGSEGVAR